MQGIWINEVVIGTDDRAQWQVLGKHHDYCSNMVWPGSTWVTVVTNASSCKCNCSLAMILAIVHLSKLNVISLMLLEATCKVFKSGVVEIIKDTCRFSD